MMKTSLKNQVCLSSLLSFVFLRVKSCKISFSYSYEKVRDVVDTIQCHIVIEPTRIIYLWEGKDRNYSWS